MPSNTKHHAGSSDFNRRKSYFDAVKRSTSSSFVVAAQLLLLAGLAITGPIVARRPLLIAAEMLALALGLWAVLVMGIGSFSIVPEVKPEASLVTRGPYRFLRHPMYSSLLCASAALVADDFSWLRIVLWVALAVVLRFKIFREERLLENAFPPYSEYRRVTKRLIPFIY